METLLMTSRPGSGRRFYFWSVAAICTACLVITALYVALIWVLSPGPSIIVSSAPRMIPGPTYATLLAYEFSYCRQRTGPVQLARELVRHTDAGALEIVPLTETLVTLEPGCHQVRMSLVTPASIPKGAYTLRLSFIDVANPRRTTTAETSEFHVE